MAAKHSKFARADGKADGLVSTPVSGDAATPQAGQVPSSDDTPPPNQVETYGTRRVTTQTIDNKASRLNYGATEERPVPASTAEHKASSDCGQPATGALPPLSWAQRRLLICLSFGAVLDGFCQSVQLPFFPGEARRHGLSLTAAGAVFSAFALSEMLAYPVMGWLALRLGVQRLYLAGLVVAGIATLTFGLLTYVPGPAAFLAGCLTVRAAEAVGTAAVLTAARTIVINQFPDRVNVAIGVLEVVKAVGLCVGPALGGGLYVLGGYGLPFYTLGGMLLATAAINVVAMPAIASTESGKTEAHQREAEQRTDQQSYMKMLTIVFSCPDNWVIFTTLFIVSMNWWALDPSLGPYAQQQLNVESSELGLFYVASLLSFAVASPVWSRLADSMRNTFLLVAACLPLTALGVLLMPPAPPLDLPPSRALLGVGMALREAFCLGARLPLLALLLRCSVAAGLQDNLRGHALVSSAFGAVYNMGKAAWPPLGAAVIQEVGLPLLASGMAALTLTLAIVDAAWGLKVNSKLKQEK
ncbi:MFS-type transporter SLC18B1-like [Amphibalanus amphitrite]|uniref:MFS-type transporter SLC18B1-like n=1 Tax=Amphibalanus amphitrite TaxID=1232801 RepID=UPI001C8FDD78|nr:MFS-type transporter SLC18B1-like [Amphibalanus amphitrite]